MLKNLTISYKTILSVGPLKDYNKKFVKNAKSCGKRSWVKIKFATLEKQIWPIVHDGTSSSSRSEKDFPFDMRTYSALLLAQWMSLELSSTFWSLGRKLHACFEELDKRYWVLLKIILKYHLAFLPRYASKW